VFGRKASRARPVDALTSVARARYQVDLTVDEEGIAGLDALADRVKYTSGQERARFEHLAAAFVAEVLRRKHGGEWDPSSGVLVLRNGTALNVGAWVAKRLHFGRGDSGM
jgi:hypothetical protein